MKQLKNEIRLWIVSILLVWVCKVLPKDAVEWWKWMAKMPNDLKE